MIPFEEAKKIVLNTVRELDLVEKDILDAQGMILAENIKAGEHIPPFDNSAMDGYALRAGDVKNTSKEKPVSLKIIEDLPAGNVSNLKIEEGKATRIMTGAPVPQGSNAVVMQEYTQEYTEEEGHYVKILRAIREGENIRPRGEDIKKDEIILKMGKLLKPADIGVLASLGITKIKVIRRPRVGILTTGTELVEITEPLEVGKIRNSNKYSLLTLMRSYQALASDLGMAKDDAKEIEAKIREGLNNDILMTVGGVSVGKYDMVHKVLEKLGMERKFWKVAIKPGKPLLFGKLGKAIIFGLPGNTVSCMVSSELFVRPAILKMCGRKASDIQWVEAELTQRVKIKEERAVFFTAHTESHKGRYRTSPTPKQGSGKLSSLSSANSLIFIPKNQRETLEKEIVKVLLLDHWYEN